MRKFTSILILAVILFTTACKSEETLENGKTYACVGLGDEDLRDPTVRYKPSVRNIVVGIVFAELLFIPPLVVVIDEFYCPVVLKPAVLPPRKS